MATKNPKFRTEIEPECSKDLFFGLHLNLGTKSQTEIELLSFTKLHENISPPQNLLKQQKLDVCGWGWSYGCEMKIIANKLQYCLIKFLYKIKTGVYFADDFGKTFLHVTLFVFMSPKILSIFFSIGEVYMADN